MRNLEADFLFRCGRLFQEYICLACAIIESQKLKFHKNNQKALRADTYKNVQEIVEERVPLGDQISRDDHNLKIGKRIILSNCNFMCYAFRGRVSITYQIDPWSHRIEEKFSNAARISLGFELYILY